MFLLLVVVALVNFFHTAVAEIGFRIANFFRVISDFNYNVIGYSLLRVQAKAIFRGDSQDPMHPILVHNFFYPPLVVLNARIGQVGRRLLYGNVDISWQILIDLLNDLLQVVVPLILFDGLQHLGHKQQI